MVVLVHRVCSIEQHLQVVRPFIKKMEDAYIEDCKAVTEKRPATKKLTLLPEVSKTLQMYERRCTTWHRNGALRMSKY